MTQIKTIKAKIATVMPVMDAIADATIGADDNTVILACLAVAVFIQDPDIASDKLLEIVQATGDFVALQLATMGEVVN